TPRRAPWTGLRTRAPAQRYLGLLARRRDPDGRQPHPRAAPQAGVRPDPDRVRCRLRAGAPRSIRSPLANLGRIKVKLGLVIVLAVATAFLVNEVGIALGAPTVLRLAVAAALALLMVQVLAHGMTKPLRQMAAGAQTIARGRYDLRV